ncbi:MAG: AraC family transcriptional regulator [Ectothiorhodospiraceae bacterium]|nr:AraC family transcriptional regulator [Ectothiorhodospiraceae bacterium]
MTGAAPSICKLARDKSGSDTPGIQRSAPALALEMVESAGEPGGVPAPPIPRRVFSQVIGDSFRYQCDLGAGIFSAQAMPMDFVLAPPNAPTWCRIDSRYRLRFLGIPQDLACRALGRDTRDPMDFGPLHGRQNRDPFITHTLETLWQELALEDETSQLFLESAVTSLLARLERLAEQRSRGRAPRGGLAAWQSSRVLDYMREHLSRPISLCELAELVQLSPCHFARAFHQSHGLPPHRYLTRLRLEKARALLAQTGLSVTEIATATGYSSQHLARRFQRYMGCTPSQYRRQMI